MEVLVLSAGYAKRLAPWSLDHPKTLLPTCQGTLLERLLAPLAARAPSIHVACRVPQHSNPKTVVADLQGLFPSAKALLVDEDPWVPIYALAQRLNAHAPLVIVNGDLVLSNEWYDLIGTVLEREEGIVVCSDGAHNRGREFSVGDDERYSLTPTSTLRRAVGISILAPGALDLVDPEKALGDDPWFNSILPKLSRHVDIRAAVTSANWSDVGSWAGLLRAEQTLHADSATGSCLCGTVEEGADIRQSLVMAGATVGKDVILEQSVVLPGAVITEATHAKNSLIAPDGLRSLNLDCEEP